MGSLQHDANKSLTVLATAPVPGRFASYIKKNPKISINNMNAASIPNRSRPSRGNNVELKLGLWNVRSLENDDKLLSILGDAIAKRLNVLVLIERRHSEKVCLKLDGGHSLYNSGPTDE